MKSVLGRSILALTLAPAVLHAQSVNVTRTTLRLFEQPSGSVLGADERVHTFYFNSLRTRYIGVEATLEYAAAATTFRLGVGCQMTSPAGKVVDGIWKIPVDILAGSTRAVGANTMFGAGKEGWQAGIYKVTCSAGRPLGETTFQMSPGPSLLGDTELRLKDVRFFLTGGRLTPVAQRDYQDRFSSAEATMIGIELSFVHPGLTRSGEVPIDCYYLASTSNVFGVLSFVYTLEPPATTGSAALGIGWEQPGHWSKGDYLAVCQIHGR
ncbi:MAG TPA: hypothetical protein VGQ17_15240, partial [Gemmatimonadales bacterium]|nr:hypothetical protein [Gemmatimonadales bacterium]